MHASGLVTSLSKFSSILTLWFSAATRRVMIDERPALSWAFVVARMSRT